MNYLINPSKSFTLLRALATKTGSLFLCTAFIYCFYNNLAYNSSNLLNYYKERHFLYSLLLYHYRDNHFLYSNLLFLYKEIFNLYSLLLFYFKERHFLYSLLLYPYKERHFLYSNLLFLYKERLYTYSNLRYYYRESHKHYKAVVNTQRERLGEEIDLLYNQLHELIHFECRYLHQGDLVIDRGCLLYYSDKPFHNRGRLYHYHGERKRSHARLSHRYCV